MMDDTPIHLKELKPGEEHIITQSYMSATEADEAISSIELQEALNYLLNQHMDQLQKLNMIINGNALMFAMVSKLCEVNKIDLTQLMKDVANQINKPKEVPKDRIIFQKPITQ